MTIGSKNGKNSTNPTVPFLLRVLAIAILAEGIIGLFFFMVAGIFKFNDTNFIGNTGLNGFSSVFYSFYIIFHIVIFLGLVFSAFFLLKLKKIGFYLFIFSYLALVFFTFYTNNAFGWTSIIVGLSFLMVLAIYYKKLA